VYTEYFYIPSSKRAHALYDLVKDYKIIFCHNSASDTTVNFNEILPYISDSSYLVLNPNKTMYPPDHPLFGISDHLAGNPFLDYLCILQHAWAIYVVDSSFFACLLPMVDKGMVTTTRLFCKPRSQYDYSSLSKKFTYLK
jgi:hypothetical protein